MEAGSEFILKLNGMKLPAEVEKQIATELQATLMRELAKTDLKGGVGIRIPKKDWLGIWLENLGRLGGGLPVLRAQELQK